MHRRKFTLSLLAFYPLSVFGKVAAKFSDRSEKAFKVSAGEARSGEHYKSKGITTNTIDIKMSAKDTASELAVFEQTGTGAKGSPPLHIHLYQDEWFYVLEGEYLFQVGGEEFKAGSGDTIFLPRNVSHAFLQLSDKAKAIVSYLPAGKMEDFFKATSQWITEPSNEDIMKIYDTHDMRVVGPPLKAG